jgi:hypothetical protein
MIASDVIIVCCTPSTSYDWANSFDDEFMLLTKFTFTVDNVHSKYLVSFTLNFHY